MSDTLNSQPADALGEPDCLRCMRKKLEAIGVVVFFREGDAWRLGNYQAEKPSDAAEVDFYCMLRDSVPEIITSYPSGLILSEPRSVEQVFGSVGRLFDNHSVLAAAVSKGEFSGVRLAWRDSAQPFSREDLRIIQCFGLCPEGC